MSDVSFSVMNVQFEFSQLDLLTKVLACSLHALVELLASAFVALIYDERVTHKCSRVRGGQISTYSIAENITTKFCDDIYVVS